MACSTSYPFSIGVPVAKPPLRNHRPNGFPTPKPKVAPSKLLHKQKPKASVHSETISDLELKVFNLMAELDELKQFHQVDIDEYEATIRHLLADLDLHEALNAAYRMRIDRIRNQVHEDRVKSALIRPRMFIERTIKVDK